MDDDDGFHRELAEVPGQVKPPIVTREEIERSGLEVVRPDVLAAYEKDGKVAANCTERVRRMHPALVGLGIDGLHLLSV